MNARPRTSLGREALGLLWKPFVWAIPFALFFGTLYGATREDYTGAFVASLVFAYVISVCVFSVEHFAVPRLRLRRGLPAGRYPWASEGGLFVTAGVVGSLLAALVLDRFVQPGLLARSGAWRTTALFSLVFTLLVTGIVYARVFYQISVERALHIERMRAELARAEYRALRAQVQPHFLFNTLNTIAALIAENPREAEDVVTRLADVFRYSLATANAEHARFGDELEFLRAYLAIEHARLGERLRFEERIEPGLESVPVPALLFQPLLENAVKYAAAGRAEGGNVRLEARRDGGSLVVTVADDGPGFAPGAAPSGHGVGLESVRERLRLAGDGHALDIASSPERGTRVTVTLPLSPPSVSPAASPRT